MQSQRRPTSNISGIGGGLLAGTLLAIAAGWLALLAGGGLSSAAGTTVNVHIVACSGAYCFQPTPANATSGDTVTFTNMTGVPHTVSRCDAADCAGQGPGSGADSFGSASTVSAGGVTSHQFSGAGTYFYYCMIHGYAVMHGVVNVAAAATQPPTSPSATPTASAKPVPAAGGAIPQAKAAEPQPPTGAAATAAVHRARSSATRR